MLSRGQPSSLPIVDVFKIVFRRLCFEATPQILPDAGADDGILWDNLPTPLLRSDFGGWLFKYKFWLTKVVRLKPLILD